MKYILHVQMVAHGTMASHTVATTANLRQNVAVLNACRESCLRRRRVGNLSGMSGEYTEPSISGWGSQHDATRTFLE